MKNNQNRPKRIFSIFINSRFTRSDLFVQNGLYKLDLPKYLIVEADIWRNIWFALLALNIIFSFMITTCPHLKWFFISHHYSLVWDLLYVSLSAASFFFFLFDLFIVASFLRTAYSEVIMFSAGTQYYFKPHFQLPVECYWLIIKLGELQHFCDARCCGLSSHGMVCILRPRARGLAVKGASWISGTS